MLTEWRRSPDRAFRHRAGGARVHGVGVEALVRSALVRWMLTRPRRVVFVVRVMLRAWVAKRRRERWQRRINGPIPLVVAVSPTMRCNYDCAGCYSRGRGTDDELATEELDALFGEAEELGVVAVVVTGGEPLLRDDILGLMARHTRLLFILITNGSLVDRETARSLGRSNNVVPVVSIEGFPADTDGRRRPGAHEAAVLAMGRLRDAGAFFGFAATNSAENTRSVGSDEFVDQMVELGCAVGFFIEYVPCGPNPEWSWVLDEGARAAFRARVLELRRTKPLLLSQFPHDEYGESNRCSAAGETSLHIGPEGDVEPCPFVAVGRDNVREGGLRAACESEFLRAVRESPVLLCRERLGCALFEHRDELMAVRESLGACSTGGTRGSRG